MQQSHFQSFTDVSEGTEGAERLAALRAVLANHGVDGLLIPRADEHQNEYLPACEERLAWLTGFTGSSGFAIVLANRAAVFSDGRYTEQLAAQVDAAAFEPTSIIDEPPPQWLAKHAAEGARIGYDPRRITLDSLGRFTLAAARAGLTFVPLTPNPVDGLWQNRPPAPASMIVRHPLKYAGVSAQKKIAQLQINLDDTKLDGLVVTDPTSLAWLFNLRGSDVPHKPLALGYALVPASGPPELFINAARLKATDAQALEKFLRLRPPAALEPRLLELGEAKTRYRFDRESASASLCDVFRNAGGVLDLGSDPIALPRAVKNEAERQGARDAQLRDGAAVANFLCWLESAAEGKLNTNTLTEIDAALKLEAFRHATGVLKDISFGSISAAGPNAALPHYRVTTASNRRITKGIYLIDSGGQYFDGTTDITRTVAIGAVTAEMKDRFTRVLKGMIAISISIFPQGTSGAQLDSFARAALWQAGLDFSHGTGHGVGSYLGVHEGPQRIAKLGTTPLRPGMIVSNEPGYYKPGAYGIRIENLVLVEERTIKGGDLPMLGFETLTLCPIDHRLIDVGLLTEPERRWLDAYHGRVRKALTPLVSRETKAWLSQVCAPL
jgi:Xaa-Pro aminopeptidase